jgi:hypothetical protein
MKVRFENFGELLIVRENTFRLEIPARSVGENAVTIDIPDTDAAQRAISNLTRRHRALHVVLVDAQEGAVMAPVSDANEGESSVVT